MKKTLQSIYAMIICLFIVLSICGCGSGNTTSKMESSNVDPGFFTDAEVITSSSDGETSDEKVASETASNDKLNSNTATSGKSWKEVLSSMPKNLKNSTITVYNWNRMNEYTGAPAVIKAFEKATGITVKWQTENFDTYLTKLASIVASGKNIPDVVRLRTPTSIGLQNIQDISVAQYDFKDAAWDQALMKDYTINGKTYGVSLKGTHIGSVNMLLYNKSLISKYGLEDPYQLWKSGKWTYDKFLEMCRAYKKESKEEAACGSLNMEKICLMYGIEGPVGYDGTKYYNRTSDAKLIDIAQKTADLNNKEKIFSSAWNADEFDRGERLFWGGASVYLRRSNSYFGTLKSAGTLSAVPYPSVEGQKTYYQGRDEYEAYGIPTGAANPKAVPYFLRYFLDPANYDINAFFCNKQVLDVYNWCMKQENTIWTTGFEMNRIYGIKADVFAERYDDLQGAQIASFFKSNSSVIDSRVKRLNDALNKK